MTLLILSLAFIRSLVLTTTLRRCQCHWALITNVPRVRSIFKLLRLIQHFKPAAVWIMESYTLLSPPQNYKAYRLNDVYCSMCWIHERFGQGKYITKIEHGILFENYIFCYFAPFLCRETIDAIRLPHQEIIGDLNILSNKPNWRLFCEIRKGTKGEFKIGGMAASVQSTFLKFDEKSEHRAMISLLNLKPRPVQNYSPLRSSLKEARRGFWIPPFTARKRRLTKPDDFTRTKSFKTNQVVNVSNLDIRDWVQLYETKKFESQLKYPRPFQVFKGNQGKQQAENY